MKSTATTRVCLRMARFLASNPDLSRVYLVRALTLTTGRVPAALGGPR